MEKIKRKLIAFAVILAMIITSGCAAIVVAAVESIIEQIEQAQQELMIDDTPLYDNAVEAYRPNVTAYCATYNMTDYIDIVMKMLSVYSTTHTTDILNSSFSYLNTRYEHKNEGITDTDYSLHIGIQQLSEWTDYIIQSYGIYPIEDEDCLMLLLQAYELQDKGYIDYAFAGHTYSASDIITYCSGSALTSEKGISLIDSTFASKVAAMSLFNEDADETQKRIVELALDYNNYAANGIKTRGGNCLAFTNDILSAAGLPIRRADCARCAGDYYGVSNDFSSIPIGAEIYCLASQQYGHVGIYIGDGYVVHCTTYKSADATLLKTVPNGYVLKQPLSSFISGYKAKCWGFSGAMSDKYPYQSGKYITGLH